MPLKGAYIFLKLKSDKRIRHDQIGNRIIREELNKQPAVDEIENRQFRWYESRQILWELLKWDQTGTVKEVDLELNASTAKELDKEKQVHEIDRGFNSMR